jgi:hypothetical protein
MPVSKNNANLDDELLSAYIDGELTDEERAAVEARLETDPAARELIAELRSLSGSLKSLPRATLAEDLRGPVLNQVGTSQVLLPRVQLSMARRLMWPAIAIAAALMLMFFQGNESTEIDKVASARGDTAEQRQREFAVDRAAAFEAREEHVPMLEAAPAPAAPASAAGELATIAEAPVSRVEASPAETPSAVALDTAIADSAVAAHEMTEAMAANDAELEGVVHLTLTDFRSGTERFNRLLASNRVQLVDEPPALPAAPATAARTVEAIDAKGQDAVALSARGTAPPGGFGGARDSRLASEGESPQAKPEMVLVEALPAQIEQILLGCAQDTEAIAEVTVDPTASGMNTTPTQQRLSDYRQYSRSSERGTQAGEYQVTPEQQGVIAALNSLPKQLEPAEPIAENQQQLGWAARFRADEQPLQAKEQLNFQYNQYRNQYFDKQARQQQSRAQGESVEPARKLANNKVESEQPLRVLFLLHPSQEPAKK